MKRSQIDAHYKVWRDTVDELWWQLSQSITLLTECTAASMHTVQCPEAYRE